MGYLVKILQIDEYTIRLYRDESDLYAWQLWAASELGPYLERSAPHKFKSEAEATHSAVLVYKRLPLVIV